MSTKTTNGNKTSPHYSVLLKEVLEYLNIKENGKYLDCTFGAGGYSKAILEQANCHLTALDQDPNVHCYRDIIAKQYPNNFDFVQTNFADAYTHLEGQKFDGIVLDLGISSMQVDEGQRGFSFMHDGPLDMRMSGSGMSAAEFIAEADEELIANVIYKYGEEVKSRYIAKAIVQEREKQPITTTSQLANIVRGAIYGKRGKIDHATKTFQAIRIYINKELESLEKILADAQHLLSDEGRIIVVSFHSLEDSIVKSFFKEYSIKKVARSKYAKDTIQIEEGKWLKTITRKAIAPTPAEVKENIRSRSAKMRVAEKIGGENAF